jgi:deoxyadenosine/deoxycytidine kinase
MDEQAKLQQRVDLLTHAIQAYSQLWQETAAALQQVDCPGMPALLATVEARFTALEQQLEIAAQALEDRA